MPVIILEALALASSLSLDAFAASFGYGSNQVKIPLLSVQIINVVCSGVLGLSLFVGTLLRQVLPHWLTLTVSVAVLFVLGLVKLLDCAVKSLIQKYNDKELQFSLFDLKFILRLYANPEDADVDASRIISPAEAASLALALSLDGLAVGFGAALASVNGWAVFLCSLATNAFAVLFGCWLGEKMARKIPFDLSWLSGVILIGLAVLKLI